MDPWIADPDSWQDMVDDWMGEPAGVLCEVDDNLRALDAHADPASFGGGPYPQMRDVDGNYAARRRSKLDSDSCPCRLYTAPALFF